MEKFLDGFNVTRVTYEKWFKQASGEPLNKWERGFWYWINTDSYYQNKSLRVQRKV